LLYSPRHHSNGDSDSMVAFGDKAKLSAAVD